MSDEKPRRPRHSGRIFRKRNIVWIQYYNSTGKQIRESSGSTDERVAEKLLRRRLDAKGQSEGGNPSYRTIRAAYLRHRLSQNDKSLPRRVDGTLILDADGLPRLDPVKRCDAFFRKVRVNKINSDMLDRFVIDLREQGYSNGSINRSLSALRAMFNHAHATKKVWTVPAQFPILPEHDAVRKGFFTLDEYRRLLAVLPAYLRPLLAIGYATGMRVSEIRGLQWRQIDFLNKLITLDPGTTKNNEGRCAPITAELDITLRAHRQACPKDFPWVCWVTDKRGAAVRVRSFSRAWNNYCCKAGLGEYVTATDSTGAVVYAKPRGPRSKPKPKMAYKGRLFHDLRRAAVKNLVDSGVPERVAMTVSGHKTRSVFDRYHIVNSNDVLEAGRRLTRFVAEQENGALKGSASSFSEDTPPLKN